MRIPQDKVKQAKKVRQAKSSLFAKLGREPRDEEIVDCLEISMDGLLGMEKYEIFASVEFEDQRSEQDTPWSQYERQKLTADMDDCQNGLSNEQKLILLARKENITLKILGVFSDNSAREVVMTKPKTKNTHYGLLVAALIVCAVAAALFEAGIAPIDFAPEKNDHPSAQDPQKTESPAKFDSVRHSLNSTTPMEKKATVSLEKDHLSIDKGLQDAVPEVKMEPRKAATKKVRLNFQGEDAAAVRAVGELFETWLRQKGYEIDTKDHDIEISGGVRLEEERMQTQMPYADPSLTLIERNFFLEQVRLHFKNGGTVPIGDVGSMLEYSASHEENWKAALADSILSGQNSLFTEVSDVLDLPNDVVDRRQY